MLYFCLASLFFFLLLLFFLLTSLNSFDIFFLRLLKQSELCGTECKQNSWNMNSFAHVHRFGYEHKRMYWYVVTPCRCPLDIRDQTANTFKHNTISSIDSFLAGFIIILGFHIECRLPTVASVDLKTNCSSTVWNTLYHTLHTSLHNIYTCARVWVTIVLEHVFGVSFGRSFSICMVGIQKHWINFKSFESINFRFYLY